MENLSRRNFLKIVGIADVKATENLDSKTGYEVMELLCCGLGRDKERSIVIVTHDLRLRDIADRILWLEDSRLTHKEFLEDIPN